MEVAGETRSTPRDEQRRQLAARRASSLKVSYGLFQSISSSGATATGMHITARKAGIYMKGSVSLRRPAPASRALYARQTSPAVDLA